MNVIFFIIISVTYHLVCIQSVRAYVPIYYYIELIYWTRNRWTIIIIKDYWFYDSIIYVLLFFRLNIFVRKTCSLKCSVYYFQYIVKVVKRLSLPLRLVKTLIIYKYIFYLVKGFNYICYEETRHNSLNFSVKF